EIHAGTGVQQAGVDACDRVWRGRRERQDRRRLPVGPASGAGGDAAGDEVGVTEGRATWQVIFVMSTEKWKRLPRSSLNRKAIRTSCEGRPRSENAAKSVKDSLPRLNARSWINLPDCVEAASITALIAKHSPLSATVVEVLLDAVETATDVKL